MLIFPYCYFSAHSAVLVLSWVRMLNVSYLTDGVSLKNNSVDFGWDQNRIFDYFWVDPKYISAFVHFYVFACLPIRCMWIMCMSGACRSQKRVSGLLELQLKTVTGCPPWVLGSKFESSMRVASALSTESSLQSNFAAPYTYLWKEEFSTLMIIKAKYWSILRNAEDTLHPAYQIFD